MGTTSQLRSIGIANFVFGYVSCLSPVLLLEEDEGVMVALTPPVRLCLLSVSFAPVPLYILLVSQSFSNECAVTHCVSLLLAFFPSSIVLRLHQAPCVLDTKASR
ncbi:hypothetical protein BC834DRAFT_902044 [Gloeopeniophorella convolvens]|nr:hypothetical protein BC834DRAFT_902044 [Gloeopeniophorella convolvens]